MGGGADTPRAACGSGGGTVAEEAAVGLASVGTEAAPGLAAAVAVVVGRDARRGASGRPPGTDAAADAGFGMTWCVASTIHAPLGVTSTSASMMVTWYASLCSSRKISGCTS